MLDPGSIPVHAGQPSPDAQRLLGILDALPAMVAYWDRELRNTMANRAYLDLFGLTSDQIALAVYSLPATRLILELTETHMPAIADSLRGDLNRLRERGVRIAIDDLGTGYSSLTRITELPVDMLKIDLTFIAGLGVDPACPTPGSRAAALPHNRSIVSQARLIVVRVIGSCG